MIDRDAVRKSMEQARDAFNGSGVEPNCGMSPNTVLALLDELDAAESERNERHMLLMLLATQLTGSAEDKSLDELAKVLSAAITDNHELNRTFELQWAADQRAIRRWQKATGRDRTWPDRSKMVEWLLEQWYAAETRIFALQKYVEEIESENIRRGGKIHRLTEARARALTRRERESDDPSFAACYCLESQRKVATTRPLIEGAVYADYDSDGGLVGIEILDAGALHAALEFGCNSNVTAQDWVEPTNIYVCGIRLVPEADGGFSAISLDLPGVASQGDSIEEAEANIIEALAGAIRYYLDNGSAIPWDHDHGMSVEKTQTSHDVRVAVNA